VTAIPSQVSDEEDRYGARSLALDVRRATIRYSPHYGHLANHISWHEPPYSPEIKLSLVVDNIFLRALQSRNTNWRIKLDRSHDGAIIGLLLSAPEAIRAHKVVLSQELLHLWDRHNIELPPVPFSGGGIAVIPPIATLCANFFGDEDGNMSKAA